MTDVVIVSPTPTWPNDFGNRKRIHRMAKDLQERGCRIHFILYPLEDPWRREFPVEAYERMKEEWDEFHLVIPTIPYHQSPQQDVDHQLDEWWDVSLEKFLWWYLRSRQFDAVIVNYIYLSRALTLAPKGTLKVLDTHDRFGGRREMLGQLGINPEFYHISEKSEAEGIRRADLVVAIKDEEKEYFSNLGAKKCITIPYSESRRSMAAPVPRDDGFLRVGMIGGRNNINRRSAENFLDNTIPRIFATAAPVKIVLAGTMCMDLQKYNSKFCVESIGPVGEVEEFYSQIDVAVVPMEVSTGQKIKVGEALSHGVPVISHAHAFEGYEPLDRCHRLKSMSDISETVIDLSFDRKALPALADKSTRSINIQEQRVALSTDRLLSEIRSNPTGLVVAKYSDVESSALLRAHLENSAAFLRALMKVEVVLLGVPEGAAGEFSRSKLARSLRTVGKTVMLADGHSFEERLTSEVKLLWSMLDTRPDLSSFIGWSGRLIHSEGCGDTVSENADDFPFNAAPCGKVVSEKLSSSGRRHGRELYPISFANWNGADLKGGAKLNRGICVFANEDTPLSVLTFVAKQAQKAGAKALLVASGDEAWLRSSLRHLKDYASSREMSKMDIDAWQIDVQDVSDIPMNIKCAIDLGPSHGVYKRQLSYMWEAGIPLISATSPLEIEGRVVVAGLGLVGLADQLGRILSGGRSERAPKYDAFAKLYSSIANDLAWIGH